MKVPPPSVVRHLLTATLLALMGGCAGPIPGPVPAGGPEPGGQDPTLTPPVAQAIPDTLPTPEPVREEPPLLPRVPGSWADSLLTGMSLEEKAAQLLMPFVLGDFAPEGSASQRRVTDLVEGLGVGGLIVSVGSPTEVAVKLNELQRRSRHPLLVAADLERGAGFRFRGMVYLPGVIALGGATEFPSLMAVGATDDPELAYQVGRITGVEALALGVHVPFAPVLDVNSNPENPIINVRALGEEPGLVGRLGAAFTRGVQEAGALATGKHFPGHGDTQTDSHLDLPVIRATRERLDSVELAPFQEAIDEGIAGIMTAHIAMPSLSGENGMPATLSRAVLTDLLREQMGFEGIVFTDAMDMYAIDRRFSRGEAAVRALEAGADVILMPPDPRAARDGIVEAVRQGRVTEERLNASVRRILDAKERVGLDRERRVPVDSVGRKVGIPAHDSVAQVVADRSVTLLRNDRDLLPLLGTRTARVLSVSFRRATDLLAGRFVNSGLRARYPRLVTADVDASSPREVYDALLKRARTSDLVVVSLYVTAVSYSGAIAIPDETAAFLQMLAGENVPHIVISFGNPYLLRGFSDVQAYMLAWSGAEVSQRAAVRALFGEIPITGRTPTRIPPFFDVGAGIQLPARER